MANIRPVDPESVPELAPVFERVVAFQGSLIEEPPIQLVVLNGLPGDGLAGVEDGEQPPRRIAVHADEITALAPPAPDAIQALLAATPSAGDVKVEEGYLVSTNPAVQYDLGAFAKGYAIDRGIDYFDTAPLYGFGLAECRRAVEMIRADGLAIHLNALQEAIQPEGQTDFSHLVAKIGAIARELEVPEVCWPPDELDRIAEGQEAPEELSGKCAAAYKVGRQIAESARAKGIETVVFDPIDGELLVGVPARYHLEGRENRASKQNHRDKG